MLIRLAVLSSLLINLSLQANPARHQPSFLFISAEFPPHQPHPHFVPHPSNSPLQSLGSIMAAVTESIKVVLMRLNDRRWSLLHYTH